MSIMGGDDGEDIPLGIETHLVDTHLTIEAVNRMRIVMTMIDDVVVSVFLDDTMMARPVDSTVGIGFQDAALICKRSHWSSLRDGILHTIGMVVA